MITLDRLREVCAYDPETGVFTGIISRGKRYKAGMPFGRPAKKGYLQVSIDGTTYQLQRLAWLYFFGSLPDCQIDHINCVPSDNRIENLRPADRSEQGCNKKTSARNTSGIKGVSYRSDTGTWRCALIKNRQLVFIKHVKTLEEASDLMAKVRTDYHGCFARL
ncbi:HNH endonuclease [Pseudomonas sp.]|uniref:HNH endonuclease n=1 Tax=Pseudomonas sp. TaxID=306 RepID=UPI0032664D41